VGFGLERGSWAGFRRFGLMGQFQMAGWWIFN
jgi:hypothetical protein